MIDEQLEDYHYKLSQQVAEIMAEERKLKTESIGWNCICNWQNAEDRKVCWQCGHHRDLIEKRND